MLNRLKSTLNTMIQGDSNPKANAAVILEKSRQKELELEKKTQVNDRVEALKKEINSLDNKEEIAKKLDEFRAEVVAG